MQVNKHNFILDINTSSFMSNSTLVYCSIKNQDILAWKRLIELLLIINDLCMIAFLEARNILSLGYLVRIIKYTYNFNKYGARVKKLNTKIIEQPYFQ